MPHAPRSATFTRRTALAAIPATLWLPSLASAQSAVPGYPSKPIRLVQIGAPGSPSDILARLTVHPIERSLGQPVVADYRAGDGGNIAVNVASKAPADGYNILLGASAQMIIRPIFDTKLGHNPEKDFVPVVLVSRQPYALFVHPDVPARNAPEFIAYLKANPGKVSFASSGVGTTNHIITELFRKTYGVDIVHVPYKAAPQSITEFISGQVQMMFNVPTALAQHVEAGRIRALAAAARQRIPLMPTVPTFAEQGLPELAAETLFAIYAPTGTPQPIVELLNAEVNKVLQQPDVQQALAKAGSLSGGGSTSELRAMLDAERAKWRPIVTALNLSVN